MDNGKNRIPQIANNGEWGIRENCRPWMKNCVVSFVFHYSANPGVPNIHHCHFIFSVIRPIFRWTIRPIYACIVVVLCTPIVIVAL